MHGMLAQVCVTLGKRDKNAASRERALQGTYMLPQVL